MKQRTNQCFANNLKLSKLNFKKFDRLPYWVGLLLESHAVEMLKSAHRTQSLDVLFLLRNNLFKVIAVEVRPLLLLPHSASEAVQSRLHTLELRDESPFSLILQKQVPFQTAAVGWGGRAGTGDPGLPPRDRRTPALPRDRPSAPSPASLTAGPRHAARRERQHRPGGRLLPRPRSVAAAAAPPACVCGTRCRGRARPGPAELGKPLPVGASVELSAPCLSTFCI